MSSTPIKEGEGYVFSRRIRCIRRDGCRLVVRLYHEKDADPVTGHWKCPTEGCVATYPFKLWKIKRDAEQPDPRGLPIKFT